MIATKDNSEPQSRDALQIMVNAYDEVWIETGGKLMGSLLVAGVVDELVIYYAPVILGDKSQAMFVLPEWTKLEEALRPRVVEVRNIGPDIRVTARFGS